MLEIAVALAISHLGVGLLGGDDLAVRIERDVVADEQLDPARLREDLAVGHESRRIRVIVRSGTVVFGKARPPGVGVAIDEAGEQLEIFVLDERIALRARARYSRVAHRQADIALVCMGEHETQIAIGLCEIDMPGGHIERIIRLKR